MSCNSCQSNNYLKKSFLGLVGMDVNSFNYDVQEVHSERKESYEQPKKVGSYYFLSGAYRPQKPYAS